MSDLDNEELEATRNLKVKGSDIDVSSIEEAIWRCKELIKPVHINWIGGMNQSAIKILIGNLEALSDMQDSANREIKKLEEVIADYQRMYCRSINNAIPKQKVKDKIEKLKKEHEKMEQSSDFIIADVIQPKIEILEELLKE